MGRPPRLTDSELICAAVAQALLGFGSEARQLRHAHAHLCFLASGSGSDPSADRLLYA